MKISSQKSKMLFVMPQSSYMEWNRVFTGERGPSAAPTVTIPLARGAALSRSSADIARTFRRESSRDGARQLFNGDFPSTRGPEPTGSSGWYLNTCSIDGGEKSKSPRCTGRAERSGKLTCLVFPSTISCTMIGGDDPPPSVFANLSRNTRGLRKTRCCQASCAPMIDAEFRRCMCGFKISLMRSAGEDAGEVAPARDEGLRPFEPELRLRSLGDKISLKRSTISGDESCARFLSAAFADAVGERASKLRNIGLWPPARTTLLSIGSAGSVAFRRMGAGMVKGTPGGISPAFLARSNISQAQFRSEARLQVACQPHA